MKIYFSTWLTKDQSYSLSKAGVSTRLTSFFFKHMASPEDTEKYLKGETLPFEPQTTMTEEPNASEKN